MHYHIELQSAINLGGARDNCVIQSLKSARFDKEIMDADWRMLLLSIVLKSIVCGKNDLLYIVYCSRISRICDAF